MQSLDSGAAEPGKEITVSILPHPAEEGGYTAECLEIPGCISEGDTLEEANVNIRKAIEACLSVIFEDSLNRLKAPATDPEFDTKAIARSEKILVATPHLIDRAPAA